MPEQESPITSQPGEGAIPSAEEMQYRRLFLDIMSPRNTLLTFLLPLGNVEGSGKTDPNTQYSVNVEIDYTQNQISFLYFNSNNTATWQEVTYLYDDDTAFEVVMNALLSGNQSALIMYDAEPVDPSQATEQALGLFNSVADLLHILSVGAREVEVTIPKVTLRLGEAVASILREFDSKLTADTEAVVTLVTGGEVNPFGLILSIHVGKSEHKIVFDFNETSHPGESARTRGWVIELLNTMAETPELQDTADDLLAILQIHGTSTHAA